MDTGYAIAFLGGVAALFSPCAALLLPSFFAFAFSNVGTLMGRVALFYLGLLITLVPLGVLAGSVGWLAVNSQTLIRAAAVLVIVLGVLTASGLALRIPGLGSRGGSRPVRDATTPFAVVVLGATYGLAGGCTGPILGSVLTVAALGGNPVYAAVLLTVFALGMVVPLVVLALLWRRFRLGERSWLKPKSIQVGPVTTTVGQLITGLLFILVGAGLLTGVLNVGLLDAAGQFEMENRLRSLTSGAGGWLVLAALVALIGLVAWTWLGERDTRRAG